jgi:hypothetical protein
MNRHSLIRSSVFAMVAVGVMVSPVAAAAATAAGPVNPLVALSAFGTPESRAAVAAQPALMPATATSTAVAASAYQYDDDDRRSSPLLALLLALGLVAAWFLLEDAVLGDDGDGLSFTPISPD